MKRLNCLLAVFTLMVLCFGFSGCGDPDDDDGNGGVNSGLVGTWERRYGTYQTETLVLGRDGSYKCIDYMEGHYSKNKYYESSTDTDKGSFSYNDATKILVINITNRNGSSCSYTRTYMVHTLETTKLVLLTTDGDSYYYNRK